MHRDTIFQLLSTDAQLSWNTYLTARAPYYPRFQKTLFEYTVHQEMPAYDALAATLEALQITLSDWHLLDIQCDCVIYCINLGAYGRFVFTVKNIAYTRLIQMYDAQRVLGTVALSTFLQPQDAFEFKNAWQYMNETHAEIKKRDNP